MCGVPYHAAESYIARLIQKGHRVAICDQMEDPPVRQKLSNANWSGGHAGARLPKRGSCAPGKTIIWRLCGRFQQGRFGLCGHLDRDSAQTELPPAE
jgi:hypothetical protein